LAKNGDDDSQTRVENGPEQVSAADYDPSLDRREDEHKRFGDNAIAVDGGDEEEVEEVEEEEDAEDDLDDMFAVTAPVKKVKKVKKVRRRLICLKSVSSTFRRDQWLCLH